MTPNLEKWIDGADVFPILPIQFFTRYQTSPEKDLVMAVLEDFVVCIVKDSVFATRKTRQQTRYRRLLAEDMEYLESEEINYLFSFIGACTLLGLDPDFIRQGIQQKMAAAIVNPPKMGEMRRHKVPTYGREKAGNKRRYAA